MLGEKGAHDGVNGMHDEVPGTQAATAYPTATGAAPNHVPPLS